MDSIHENERNCLSFWYPKLDMAGIPTPLTQIYKGAPDLAPLLDGKDAPGFRDFVNALLQMARVVAGVRADGKPWPFFLRTGQGSGKHSWGHTCYVDVERRPLDAHIVQLVEWSHMVSLFGLPHDVWVVRRLLPTKPLTTMMRYDGFPLVREVRCFVEGGKVVCAHPYWPLGSLEKGLELHQTRRARAKELFDQMLWNDADAAKFMVVAQAVADIFKDDGAWSVDLLETVDGRWFCTDMATAAQSFHYEGCPNETKFGTPFAV